MRLLVAGGRDFDDRDLMIKELNKLCTGEDLVIITGMAKGADLLAYNLAKENNVPYETYPADWKDMSEPCTVKENAHGKYNALAGFKRNRTMGDTATHLIVFWDGKSQGTKDMLAYMTKLGKPVTIVEY